MAIQGNLNFAGNTSNLNFGADPASLSSSYNSAYNNSLKASQTNYNNILAGYQQTQGDLQSYYGKLSGQYGDLSGKALSFLGPSAYGGYSSTPIDTASARGMGGSTDAATAGQWASYGQDAVMNQPQFQSQGVANNAAYYVDPYASVGNQSYGGLSDAVLNTIKGIGASQDQSILDNYTNQAGLADQRLIDSGLSNSTVRSSVQRGIGLDKQKAYIANANAVAGLTAGYQSNIGLAGLSEGNQNARFNANQGQNNSQFYSNLNQNNNQFNANLGQNQYQFGVQQQNQMSQARANLAAQIGLTDIGAQTAGTNEIANQGNRQLDWMNSVNVGYPDAGLYASLGSAYGQAQQNNFDRLASTQQANADRAAAIQQANRAYARGNQAATPVAPGLLQGGNSPGFSLNPQGNYGGGAAYAQPSAGGGRVPTNYTSQAQQYLGLGSGASNNNAAGAAAGFGAYALSGAGGGTANVVSPYASQNFYGGAADDNGYYDSLDGSYNQYGGTSQQLDATLGDSSYDPYYTEGDSVAGSYQDEEFDPSYYGSDDYWWDEYYNS